VSASTNNRPARGLAVEGLSIRYPGAALPVLRDAGLRVGPGEVAGLTGRSGSGKTSLLKAVSGLVPWLTPASVRGEVLIDRETVGDLDPGQRAHLVASCLDRPESQLFLATVGQEIAAARRLYGGSAFVDRVATAFGLRPLLDRRVTELSSGERQRVALTVALAGCPRPLVLDEPTTHLDAGAESVLTEVLTEAGRSGSAVLLTEQAGWRVGGAVSAWHEVGSRGLSAAPSPGPPSIEPPAHAPGDGLVLECRGLGVSRAGRVLIEEVDLDLHEGEIVALSGPNGCGKSTLARVLAGLGAPDGGELTTRGRPALMLPEAELQLFGATVASEVSSAGVRQEERSRVLRRHRLEHLAARAPWTLSRGEQQRLVHAALDLLRPEVMIVDEPTQGLDADDLIAFLELIRRRSAKGRAYLVISHRPEVAAAAHRHFQVVDRRLRELSR
jgi:energy-coupling factor transport system ATP-binding protein